MRHPLFLVVLLVSAALPAQTYIVAQGGGGNFTDLPAAIAAVPSGAVLRVRPGTYSAFTVQNKSLSILGDSSATVIVNANADVVLGPIAASERIAISGLKVFFLSQFPLLANFRLEVRDAAGPVWLDEIEIGGGGAMLPSYLQFQLQVNRCANVHLHRCRSLQSGLRQAGPNPLATARVETSAVEMSNCALAGRDSDTAGGQAAPALELLGSRALLVDCDLQGGRGEDMLFELARPGVGGPALRAQSGSVVDIHGARSRYLGGKGGNGYVIPPYVFHGARGGDGLELASSHVRLIGVSPQGGVAGLLALPNSDGKPFSLDASSSVKQISGQGPTASLAGTPAPGNNVASVLAANANDLAIVFLGLQPLFTPIPGLITHGGLMCSPDVVVDAVFVPASGTLSVPWGMPPGWPIDRPAWFQFVVLPAAAPAEVWGSNSVPVLVKS